MFTLYPKSSRGDLKYKVLVTGKHYREFGALSERVLTLVPLKTQREGQLFPRVLVIRFHTGR